MPTPSGTKCGHGIVNSVLNYDNTVQDDLLVCQLSFPELLESICHDLRYQLLVLCIAL